jgi:hypothetical protein
VRGAARKGRPYRDRPSASGQLRWRPDERSHRYHGYGEEANHERHNELDLREAHAESVCARLPSRSIKIRYLIIYSGKECEDYHTDQTQGKHPRARIISLTVRNNHWGNTPDNT